MDKRKLLSKAINNPGDMRFPEAVALVEAFGFSVVGAGESPHILHPRIRELVNLQEVHGEAKAYQVRSSSRS